MFEAKIQRAWEGYQEDYGLSRLLLILAFYNLFLFFISGIVYHQFQRLALLPIILVFPFVFYRKKYHHLPAPFKFGLNIIPITISTVLDYYLIGEIDRSVGIIERKDALFYQFDQTLFSVFGFERSSDAFYFLTRPLSDLLFGFNGQTLLYDLLMMAYMSYFLLPIFGGVQFFKQLSPKKKQMIGVYFFSVLLYFSLNFLFYLIVPVTGPQYFVRESFSYDLPLSQIGFILWNLVHNGQTTFIDCFPSGHTGIAFLVCLWMYRVKNSYRFAFLIVTLLIISATIAMRYHYILDLLCAFPLALFCHEVSWYFLPDKSEIGS